MFFKLFRAKRITITVSISNWKMIEFMDNNPFGFMRSVSNEKKLLYELTDFEYQRFQDKKRHDTYELAAGNTLNWSKAKSTETVKGALL